MKCTACFDDLSINKYSNNQTYYICNNTHCFARLEKITTEVYVEANKKIFYYYLPFKFENFWLLLIGSNDYTKLYLSVNYMTLSNVNYYALKNDNSFNSEAIKLFNNLLNLSGKEKELKYNFLT